MSMMDALRRLTGIGRQNVAMDEHVLPTSDAETGGRGDAATAPIVKTGRGADRRDDAWSRSISTYEDKEESEWIRAADQAEIRVSRWDGRSIDDLPLDHIRQEPRAKSVAALSHTVPERYRGSFDGVPVKDGGPGHGENSEWEQQTIGEILAVDRMGRALVLKTEYNAYLGAESDTLKTMTAKQAYMFIEGLRTDREQYEKTELRNLDREPDTKKAMTPAMMAAIVRQGMSR